MNPYSCRMLQPFADLPLRKPGLLSRVRRAFWRTYHRNRVCWILIPVVTVVGVLMLHGLLAYGRAIDESINNVMDEHYIASGVTPTRDRRESDDYRRQHEIWTAAHTPGQEGKARNLYAEWRSDGGARLDASRVAGNIPASE